MNASINIAARARLALGNAENVPSPCVSVCRMNASSGLCEGCARTLDEIARWSTMAEDDRRAVWARIGQRAQALQEIGS
jgi:predicted Fe-S protein YdhL (DUF1289 family)